MTTAAKSFNLADLFESVADAVPEQIAFISDDRRLNYRQLDDRASLGISHGDHIGLQLRNGSEYIEGMLEAYKLRAAAININFNYVADELEYLSNDADLVGLLVHQEFAAKVVEVLPKSDSAETHTVCSRFLSCRAACCARRLRRMPGRKYQRAQLPDAGF